MQILTLLFVVAIMLACLAAKFRWKKKRLAEGKPIDKPNIVFGSNAHGATNRGNTAWAVTHQLTSPIHRHQSS